MSAASVLIRQHMARWQAGDRRPVESLVAEAPDLADEDLLDLIYAEIMLREESGERPSLEEYSARFPRLREQLRLQFEVHEVFASGGGDEAEDDAIPSIPGYIIEERLGRGGMGIVYAARQSSLGRRVAVKLLPAGAARDPDALARFHAEARLASSLNHPHIATILDFGTHDERPFMVMELVEGRTLTELIRKKPTTAEATKVVRQVAQALAIAHGSGIVHRDIKPANVMVRQDGYVKVLDFGLARLMRLDRADESGTIAGTLRYMAPEQLGGEPATRASDVYSLGLVLFELLTQRYPFDSATTAPSARALNPEVSPELDALLTEMLAASPARRPTMTAVEKALAEGGTPLRASTRKPARLFLAVAVALVVSLVCGGLLLRTQRAGPIHAKRPSVVVLPFDVVGDASLSYLSAGVTEDLTAMLARAPELTVRSTSAAYAYKGDAKDTRRVGRELEVEYVLEGSVQKLDQKLRITARLVDTRTGDDVWGERLDRTGADPWALEDEVSGRIVGALTGELGQVKRAQYRAAWGADSTNMSEYDYYLRGHELYIRLTPEDNARAGDIWRAGLVAVPDSSLLAVKLGWHHFVRANLYLQGDGISDYAQASALVRRAVAKPNKAPLENRLSHWLFAYVSAQEGDYDRAIREMEVTLSLAPYDAFQLGDLSTVQIFAAQPDKALEMLAKALASDPANRPFYQQLRGWALHVAGRYEESIVALTEGIELPVVPLMQAVNHAELGRPDEAKRLVAQSLAKRPDLSQTKWRAANFHRDPRIVERQITRLAAAGLP